MEISNAKLRLRIPVLWRRFGFQGEPKPSCRCPWREDRKPSFSVSPDGLLFHDFATGEGGDAVDFLQRATGLSRQAAVRKFIEMAGHGGNCPPARQPRVDLPQRRKPNLPALEIGDAADLDRLSDLRQVSIEGLRLAQRRGLLWFATLRTHRAWVVTDAVRLNAQARRLDGKPWEHVDAKSWTLPGSWASWPIGIREATPFACIALVEGGPDLLAAFGFMHCEDRADSCGAVGMMGAGHSINADALPGFASKTVRIFAHADADGRMAAERWTRQLQSVGAVVDAFDFAGLRKVDGSAVKDLNDCTQVHADDFENNRELWNLMP